MVGVIGRTRSYEVVLLSREFVVNLRVLVEVLAADEPDEILPRLLGRQFI